MKKIDVIADYVKDGIEAGTMKVAEATKGASVTAVQGVPGQIVKTYTRSEDGSDFYETENVVKNGKNGQPGWIVTNPDGEKYIVDDEIFREKYAAGFCENLQYYGESFSGDRGSRSGFIGNA